MCVERARDKNGTCYRLCTDPVFMWARWLPIVCFATSRFVCKSRNAATLANNSRTIQTTRTILHIAHCGLWWWDQFHQIKSHH